MQNNFFGSRAFQIKISLLLSFTFFFLINLAVEAQKQMFKLSQDEAMELSTSQKWKPIKSKSVIPRELESPLRLKEMSDVGGKFDPGCTGPDPHSRYIAGGTSGKYVAVIYEIGGFAYRRFFNVYEIANGSYKQVYGQDVELDRVTEIRKKFGF